MSFVQDHPFLSGFIGGYAYKTATTPTNDDNVSQYHYLKGKYEALETCLDAIEKLSYEINLDDTDSHKYELLQDKIKETMSDIKIDMDVLSLSI